MEESIACRVYDRLNKDGRPHEQEIPDPSPANEHVYFGRSRVG
jgi:hypothetical protein